MAPINFNLIKDEFTLPAWLLVGAVAQLVVSYTAPAQFAFVPATATFLILALNWVLEYTGLLKYRYLRNAVLDRHSVLFPEEDGSRPETMGSKPVAMFLIGIRSNHPLGRLLPSYQKLNDYLDRMYDDCAANRATNGYLGRTPDLLPQDFSSNNTLISISYWKDIEHLEAFSRRPVHLQGLKYLVSSLLGSKPHDLGVVHEVLVCPPGHWEAIYSNLNPWGFGSLQWPMPKTKALQGPYVERDQSVLNGMWGRMGNKIRQGEVDKKLAELEKMAAAMGGQQQV